MKAVELISTTVMTLQHGRDTTEDILRVVIEFEYKKYGVMKNGYPFDVH